MNEDYKPMTWKERVITIIFVALVIVVAWNFVSAMGEHLSSGGL